MTAGTCNGAPRHVEVSRHGTPTSSAPGANTQNPQCLGCLCRMGAQPTGNVGCPVYALGSSHTQPKHPSCSHNSTQRGAKSQRNAQSANKVTDLYQVRTERRPAACREKFPMTGLLQSVWASVVPHQGVNQPKQPTAVLSN